jgi:hypothetical protein
MVTTTLTNGKMHSRIAHFRQSRNRPPASQFEDRESSPSAPSPGMAITQNIHPEFYGVADVIVIVSMTA